MCRTHWHMVPKRLQRLVWRSWRAFRTDPQAYAAALEEAVHAVYVRQAGR